MTGAQVLPHIPQPSIYRHLKVLLEAGMVSVGEKPDLLADRVGFTEIVFYASQAKLDEFFTVLQPTIQKLAGQVDESDRMRRKLAFISLPTPRKEA